MTTPQWRTLMDWQPSATVDLQHGVLAEAPAPGLSPPLTAADDDGLLYVDCQVSRDRTGPPQATDDLIWSAFPAIRAGDYRAATAATGTTWTTLSVGWGEVGLLSHEAWTRQLLFGKGQNGRPAISVQDNHIGLQRFRVRLLVFLAAAPAVTAPPASTPAATPSPAATRAPATLGGRTFQELPVTIAPNQRIQALIGGVSTTIALRWDTLSGAWYLGVEQAGRNLLVGRRIVPGLRLLPMNLGWQLVAAPLSDAMDGVGRQAWGNTHLLLFVPTPYQVSWLR